MKLLTLALLFLALSVTPALAQHSATLNWSWSQGTGDAATGFHIWRSTGTTCTTGQTTPYATVSSSTILTYVDLVVLGGTSYCYTVSSFNSAGDSAMSNSYTAVIPIAAPPAPTGLTGSAK